MGYPELAISPDHLTKIAAIERFAGGVGAIARMGEGRREQLRRQALIASTAALLRLEGRGSDVVVVERTLGALKQHELDFSRHSEEILGLYRALDRYTVPGRERRSVFDPSLLLEIHGAVLEEVPTLRQSRGHLREDVLIVQAFDATGVPVGDVFAAPPPAQIALLLEETFAGMRVGLDEGRWHPLLLISWLVARLSVIQPFHTGSLRSIQILCDMCLQDEGYLHTRLLSLAEIIEEDAGEYFVALRHYQRTMDGDQSGLGKWHGFFLDCLVRQAARVGATLRERREDADLPPLQQEILDLVRAQGKTTLREAGGATGANRNTLKAHLKKLVETGSLVMKGTGKGTSYELP